jgi:hypothetical protein
MNWIMDWTGRVVDTPCKQVGEGEGWVVAFIRNIRPETDKQQKDSQKKNRHSVKSETEQING